MRTRLRGPAIVLVVAMASLAGCSSTPDDPLTEGLSAHADGKLDEAERHYRDVLVSDPGNKFAHYNLGLIAQTNGDEKGAIASYRKALATDARFVPALFNLAILQTDPKPAEAIHLYRKVIDLQPRYAAAHLNLGFLLKSTGATAEGDRELQKALELDPELSDRVNRSPTPRGPATPEP